MSPPADEVSADEVSADWIKGLRSSGPAYDEAVDRLHPLLLRIARSETARRSGTNGIVGRELDDMAHQAAADAMVSILRRIKEFRGDSKFTTWAYKFVIFEVSTKIGRHAWRRDRVRMDHEAWDRLPGRLGSGPDDVAESRELVAAVRTAVTEQLTAHQRRIFVALVVEGTPLDALVVELDTNRNAIYKTMFDARRKLRAHLVTHGHLDGEGRSR